MNDFRFCADQMEKSLKKLKKLSYEQVKGCSKEELQQFINSKCLICTSIRRKIYVKGWVKVEMEVKDEEEAEKMEWPDELKLPEVFVESASSVNGFEIYSDGKIVEMHPEGYDD